ncbi:hypothetical protein [Paractinoplanes ovalisporus]|nr:hypothetical protein [Actinoplanes ovalisporus]
MTTQDVRPEVAQRMQEHSDNRRARDAPPINQVIAAFLAGAQESQSKRLARQVIDEHREFFDLNGDR